MAMYARCSNGHDVKVNDMPAAAAEWPAGKFSQGQFREPGTSVVCDECGDSFVPKDLFLKAS